jgi:hypothetical protein
MGITKLEVTTEVPISELTSMLYDDDSTADKLGIKF